MLEPGFDQRIAAVRRFTRFYTQRIGVLNEGLLQSAFSLAQGRVLYELANRAQPTASELARDLGLDAGYLSRILTAFTKRGWMKRERSRSDARKSHLKLTPKGRKVFDSLDRRARDQISDLLAPLQPEQQQRLHGHLQGVQALLGRTSRDAQDVILREHRPGDMGWIIQRHGALYASEYGWNEEFEALVAEICAAFIRKLDPSCERCWIAERNGTPVGCVMLVRHSRTIAKLRLLLVEPSERGTGLGRRLVTECIEYARRAGYQTMTLWTQSILTAARRLYEAAGFRLVKSEPHESFGAKLVSETWELSLSAGASASAARPPVAPRAS
jgi:DNA-binding MarR family transcriptional regulator/GNAT superfamily N-acetyltransferase